MLILLRYESSSVLMERPLEISEMSTKARIACGVALMVLGYAPVVFDFLHEDSSSTSMMMVCDNSKVLESDSISSFEFMNPLSVDESLTEKFMYQDVNRDPVTITASVDETQTKSANSSLKKIAHGRYAGAQLVKGNITSNFYTDARRLGVPAYIVDRVIHTLSAKIDFRRALRKGSAFEIIFSKHDGLLYSKISTRRCCASVYMMKNGNKSEYFFEDGSKAINKVNNSEAFGQPLRGKLLVSSPFGMRKHPVYKKYKFHKGVDFKAQSGTSVYAIYDGVVTRASTFAGYGKCVDIKHSSGYVSRYAHLSGYKVKVGDRVKKGALIALSGNTGTSTGSHLHLELARYNKCLNPLSVKMMPTVHDKGSCNRRELNALKSYVEREINKVSSI